MLPIIDIILIIILAGFVFYGLFFGFIRAIGSIIALLVGLWAASHYYLVVFNWSSELFFGHNNFGKVVVFMLMFSLIDRLAALGFAMLDRTFKIISIIPFLKSINRLAGAVFGLLLGVVVLSVVIYFLSSYPLIGGWLNKLVSGSKVVPYFGKAINIIKPFLPQILDKIKFQ